MKNKTFTSWCALLLAVCLQPLAALFAADAAPQKVKPYPLNVCLVSGEKLGSMGKPVTLVREGQEVKLCCKGCVKDFEKEPAKFLKKLEAEQKKKAK